MKDINYVIEEVARRTGLPENVVAEAIRSAASDVRDFMNNKEGYSIYWPSFGTFSYRVTAIRDFVQRQRQQMAYWMYRLTVGETTGNQRTIEAANENIEKYRHAIKASLLVKQEFLTDHTKFNDFKTNTLRADTVSTIERLQELLDVADLVRKAKAKYKGPQGPV